MTDILDAEVIEPGMELDIRPAGTLFRTEDAGEGVSRHGRAKVGTCDKCGLKLPASASPQWS